MNINYSTKKLSLLLDEYNIPINNCRLNDSIILNTP